VLALVVACGGKSSESPVPIGALDRSCKVDTDCTMTGDPSCCGTSCGTNFGAAVNVKAWQQARQAREARCKGAECHVMCQKLPDCRDETVAVCTAGTCTAEVKPNETCVKLGVTPEAYCESPADCTARTVQACCPVCAETVMTTRAVERARAAQHCENVARTRCSCSSRARPATSSAATSADARRRVVARGVGEE